MPGHNECWVCDRTIYSLIFWNQLIGTVELKKFTKGDEDFFISKIREVNPEGVKLNDKDNKGGCPMIYGSFTDWKPTPMLDIREYCE